MAIIERPAETTEVVIDLTLNCPPGELGVDTASSIEGYQSTRESDDGRVAIRFHRRGVSTGDVVRRLGREVEERCGAVVVRVEQVG